MRHADEVIARIKSALGARRDADIFDPLDVKRSTVSSWRTRDSVPGAVLDQVARETGVSRQWLESGLGEMRIAQDPGAYHAAPQGEPAGLHDAEDPRLDAVLAWWGHWWDTHDDDERTWALVQLKRAIPEADGWIRRWLQEHQPR